MSASTQNLVAIAQSLPAGVTAKVTVMKSAHTRRRRSLLNKTNSSGRSGLGSHDPDPFWWCAQGDLAILAGLLGALNLALIHI